MLRRIATPPRIWFVFRCWQKAPIAAEVKGVDAGYTAPLPPPATMYTPCRHPVRSACLVMRSPPIITTNFTWHVSTQTRQDGRRCGHLCTSSWLQVVHGAGGPVQDAMVKVCAHSFTAFEKHLIITYGQQALGMMFLVVAHAALPKNPPIT